MAALRPLVMLMSILGAAHAVPSDRALHEQAIVVDSHSDCTQRITYDAIDIAVEQPDMQVDLPKMKRGGLDAEFFSIFVAPWKVKPDEFYGEALKQFAAVHALIDRHPKTIAWAKTAADVRRNAKHGVISALFGVEGGHALLPGDASEMIAHLRKFHELGARYMTLTWSIASPIGGSSGDDSDGQGLTEVGRQIIDEMERLGVMVDVSHVSDPLFWDVIRYVRKPVIASHSSARALANVPRNMSDAMLKAVARNGGAVCVNFGPEFLDESYARSMRDIMANVRKLTVAPEERRKWLHEQAAALPGVPLAKLIDHIDHIAQVAGIDHVCLGSDFDGIARGPIGMESVADLPAITVELRKRGYAPGDVEKILGGNTLRVLEASQPAS